MSILSYIAIAIAAVVLIIVALFYLAKGLINLMFLFLRLLPTMIKATIYWAVVVLVCFVLGIADVVPTFPFIVYPLLYVVILGLILVRKFIKQGSIFDTYYYDGDDYVLNKKSKVIHKKNSGSEETISPHHRKEISYSEARELISNNDKYRFKK